MYSLQFSQIELSIEQFDILGLGGILNEVIVQKKKEKSVIWLKAMK